MKNHRFANHLLSFAFVLFSIGISSAQSILDCENMCVSAIAMNAEGGQVDITLQNGSTMINYPIVMIVVAGDTVANADMSFFFFAQLAGQVTIHTVPTTLTSIPANFECQVLVRDNITGQTCVLDYPCIQTNVGLQSEISFEVYPNPGNEFLQIRSTTPVSEIAIYDISGNLVENSAGSNITIVDISRIRSGHYNIIFKTVTGARIARKFNKI